MFYFSINCIYQGVDKTKTYPALRTVWQYNALPGPICTQERRAGDVCFVLRESTVCTANPKLSRGL